MKPFCRLVKTAAILVLLVFVAGPLCMVFTQSLCIGDRAAKDWAFHLKKRAYLSPEPAAHPGAVVQVFAARSWGLRGLFAEHTWIAVKPYAAETYTSYQVKGWYFIQQHQPPLEIRTGMPDCYWMGAPPRVLFELRGRPAQQAIARIAAAAAAYPYRDTYRLWPGPNSNTFTACMLRAVPELACDLPVTAIGKDYLPHGKLLCPTPGHTGYQLSVWGVFGFALGAAGGVEVNLLGLNVKLNFRDRVLELPGVGRVLG